MPSSDKKNLNSPLLYSLRGYQYCNLLLALGRHAAVRDPASKTIIIVIENNWLLNIALDTLNLGRAHLGLALDHDGPQRPSAATRDARTACAHLEKAVDGLRDAGTRHHIPRGLLARVAFRRSVGDWDKGYARSRRGRGDRRAGAD